MAMTNFISIGYAKTARAYPHRDSLQDTGRPASWFPGCNGLRFLAAALVVIMHIHNNMGISGLHQLPAWPILFKGLYAVSFFFVLSGFLITYLLMKEIHNTGTISIKKFYLRRVFRIWPLYFLIIGIGCCFYWKLAPMLGQAFDSNYPHGLAVLLYAFFLANLMNSLYHVGGMLHVTWSIAVEEQFYLFWAPMVKKYRQSLPWLILLVTLLSFIVNILNTLNFFHLSKGMQAFLSTLQFHYMGLGAGFAWLLFTHRSRLLDLAIFRKRGWQCCCLALLLAFLLLYKRNRMGELLIPLPLGLLFGWLIINVSSNSRKIAGFENRVFNYLGRISYGIYMFHMPVVYATAWLTRRYGMNYTKTLLYFPLYFLVVFMLTIVLASLSYAWLESPILQRTKKWQS